MNLTKMARRFISPVTRAQVAAEHDPDCDCKDGVRWDGDSPSLCKCAQENFARRRGHQTRKRGKVRIWLAGCPRE